jgi:predicted DNA-binding transcriptional regulator AlpA
MPEANTTTPAPADNFIAARYVTEFDLAAMLGLNVRTLRRWWAERTGPPVTKIGKFTYYQKSAVERWLSQREQRPCRTRVRRREAA